MNEQKKVIEINKNPWQGSFLFACWTFLIILVLFCALRVLMGLEVIRNLPDWIQDVGFSFLSQIVIMLGVPIVGMRMFWRRKRGIDLPWNKTFSNFGFNRPGWRVIGYAVLLGLLAYVFNLFVAGFFSGILNLIGFRFPTPGEDSISGIGGLLVSFVLIAVLPGLCEEVTHRGMLLRSFADKFGMMRAILLSSVLFGFMHLNIVQVFYATILGFVMAMSIVATRSIWTGVIIHFMNNGIGTYLSFAYRNNLWGGDLLNRFFEVMSSSILIYIFFVILVYISIFGIIHVFAKENYEKNKATHLSNMIARDPTLRRRFAIIGDNFDEITRQIEERVAFLPKFYRTMFYLDSTVVLRRKGRIPMTAAERTVFWGIMFFGGLVTAFTLVWGLL